jgi:hypothetical protein
MVQMAPADGPDCRFLSMDAPRRTVVAAQANNKHLNPPDRQEAANGCVTSIFASRRYRAASSGGVGF